MAVFFASSLVVGGLAFAMSDSADLDAEWLPLAIAAPAVAQLAYVVWAIREKGTGLRQDLAVSFRPSDLAVGAGLFVAGMFMAGFVGAAMDWLFDTAPSASVADAIEDSDDPGGGISVWIYVMAFLGATLIPFIEEVVFRGLWWSALEKRGMKEHWVLLLTSVVFAAIHLEPVRFPILFALGLAIGYGRIRTGRIGPCIAAHCYINTLAFVFLLASLD